MYKSVARELFYSKQDTIKLPSYGAALRNLRMDKAQENRRYMNNQAENSHLHFRRRERGMGRFRSVKSLQKFASIQSIFQNHFNHQRHIEKREHFVQLRESSLQQWREIAVA